MDIETALGEAGAIVATDRPAANDGDSKTWWYLIEFHRSVVMYLMSFAKLVNESRRKVDCRG